MVPLGFPMGVLSNVDLGPHLLRILTVWACSGTGNKPHFPKVTLLHLAPAHLKEEVRKWVTRTELYS